jgi:hypothetical protein
MLEEEVTVSTASAWKISELRRLKPSGFRTLLAVTVPIWCSHAHSIVVTLS